jgi:hypothetical protein
MNREIRNLQLGDSRNTNMVGRGRGRGRGSISRARAGVARGSRDDLINELRETNARLEQELVARRSRSRSDVRRELNTSMVEKT